METGGRENSQGPVSRGIPVLYSCERAAEHSASVGKSRVKLPLGREEMTFHLVFELIPALVSYSVSMTSKSPPELLRMTFSAREMLRA